MKYIEYGLKNGFIEEIIEGINRLQGSNVVQILNGDIHLQEDLRFLLLLVPSYQSGQDPSICRRRKNTCNLLSNSGIHLLLLRNDLLL